MLHSLSKSSRETGKSAFDGLRVPFGGLKVGRLSEALKALDFKDYQKTIDVFFRLLQECINKKDLAAGRDVCRLIMRCGYKTNVFLGSHLIRMFAACDSLFEAVEVFSRLHEPNLFAWTAIISAHAKLGHGEQAIKLFHDMQQCGVYPDACVSAAVLKACSTVADVNGGELIHAHLIERGLDSDVSVGNTLISMYTKCGSLEHACRVFDTLPKRNVVSWSAMIAGYEQHGCGEKALKLFHRMQQDGIEPNHVTFVSVLKACTNTIALDQGKLTHVHIIEHGFESDLCIGNTLIGMYAKCGSLDDSHKVFEKLPKEDLVTWNAMITAYAQHEHGHMALQLFHEMQQKGQQPDNVTFASILKACSSILALDQGKMVHGYIIKSKFKADAFVLSALVDIYAKCGSLVDAQNVFDQLQNRDMVAWSALIGGYVQCEYCQEALQLFQQMQQEGKKPDRVLFISILKACSSLAALEQGKLIHAHIIESGFESDVQVGNSLIDMYTKCGSFDRASGVFDILPKHSIAPWNAIMAGYAFQGSYKLAMQYFNGMQREGLNPDDVSFVCLLSACSHMGYVDEGCSHFNSMSVDYGIIPELEHYNCMADLLGRVGCLNEAEDLLLLMPSQFNVVGWTSLLSNCRRYKDVQLGRCCFKRIVEMDREYASAYWHMSKIYADADMWEDAEKTHKLRKSAEAWKEPGKAFIETNNKVHEFLVGDQSHLQNDEVYAKLKRLSLQVKEEGYTPGLNLLLKLVEADG